MSRKVQGSHRGKWRVAYWTLFAAFLVAAALNMAHVRAGVATSHLADLVLPAWLYIVFRGLHQPHKRSRVSRTLGATPELSAVVLFVGSTVTEFSQRYWPAGMFAGTYDPFDLVAYGIGVGTCYAADRYGLKAAPLHLRPREFEDVRRGAAPDNGEPPNPSPQPTGSAGG